MESRDKTPTVLHLTHWKAGSQWIYQILAACAPERIVPPHPQGAQVLLQPVLPGMVYPTLYLARAQIEHVTIPEPVVTFAVIRDLRDTLVSWYFHSRYNLKDRYRPVGDHDRSELETLSIQEGLRLSFPRIAQAAVIQRSWINADALLLRYEDLVEDEQTQLGRLIRYCRFGLETEEIERIIRMYTFERMAGRPRGTEDVTSHYRKGVAGDWKRYLTGDALEEFKDLFDDVLVETGYEPDRTWGAVSPARHAASAGETRRRLVRRYNHQIGNRQFSPVYATSIREYIDRSYRGTPQRMRGGTPTCWCGSTRAAPFGPGYSRCLSCGTLICTEPTLGDVAAECGDEETAAELSKDDLRAARRFLFEDLRGEAGLAMIDALLQHRTPGGRVLEMRTHAGALATLAQRAGFDAAALELRPWIVELGRQVTDVPLHVGRLEEQGFAPGSFDAVFLGDALGSLPDPLGTLRTCLTLLSDDGVLLIVDEVNVPDGTFEELRARGSRVPLLLDPTERSYLFSAPGLERLLREAGFAWSESTPHESVQAPAWTGQQTRLMMVASRGAPEIVGGADREQAMWTSSGGRRVQAILGLYGDLRQLAKQRDFDLGQSARQLASIMAYPPPILVQDAQPAEEGIPHAQRSDSDLLVQQLTAELTAKEAVVQGLAGELETKEAALQQLTRELEAKEAVLRDMVAQLTAKEELLHRWARDLEEKERVIKGMAAELDRKEMMLRNLLAGGEKRS